MADKHPIRPGAKFIVTRRSGGWSLEVQHAGEGTALSGVRQLSTFAEMVKFIEDHYDLDEAHSSGSSIS